MDFIFYFPFCLKLVLVADLHVLLRVNETTYARVLEHVVVVYLSDFEVCQFFN